MIIFFRIRNEKCFLELKFCVSNTRFIYVDKANIVKILIDNNATVDAVNKDGLSALQTAAQKGKTFVFLFHHTKISTKKLFIYNFVLK